MQICMSFCIDNSSLFLSLYIFEYRIMYIEDDFLNWIPYTPLCPTMNFFLFIQLSQNSKEQNLYHNHTRESEGQWTFPKVLHFLIRCLNNFWSFFLLSMVSPHVSTTISIVIYRRGNFCVLALGMYTNLSANVLSL